MLFLLLLLTLQFKHAIADFDTDPSSDELWCGSMFEDDVVSIPDVPRVPPGAVDPTIYDKNNYVPFNVLFIIHPSVKQQNQLALKKATEAVRKRLVNLVMGPRLVDVRFQRKLNGSVCDPAICGQIIVPSEYVSPCYDENNVLVAEPGVDVAPNADVQKMNKANYSLVMFIGVKTDDAYIAAESKNCRQPNVGAFALYCQRDPRNSRPTHGRMIFCLKPTDYKEGQLDDILLHETLHVVVPDLVGLSDPINQCNDTQESFNRNKWANKCRGKTWKSDQQPWTDKDAKVGTRKRYISILAEVANASKTHFDCPQIEGFELHSTKDSTTNVTKPDFGHWNKRLFVDEILAPSSMPNQRLSIITLSAIKSHSWYKVDLNKAEPLFFSRPQGLKCEITKSCHDIIKNAKGNSSKSITPYCDKNASTPRSMCFDNNRARMQCKVIPDVDDCPIRFISYLKPADGYDNIYCEKSTKVSDLGNSTGGAVGNNTICVTIPVNNTLRPVCVKYECWHETIWIRLFPNDKTKTCVAKCPKAQSNRLVQFQLPAACLKPENDRLDIICPNYEQVCKGTYLKAPTGTGQRSTWRWFCSILGLIFSRY